MTGGYKTDRGGAGEFKGGRGEDLPEVSRIIVLGVQISTLRKKKQAE